MSHHGSLICIHMQLARTHPGSRRAYGGGAEQVHDTGYGWQNPDRRRCRRKETTTRRNSWA